MRILFLTNLVPYPLHGGVQLRVFHLARRIARKHEVTLGCHSWDRTDCENADLLSRRYIPTVCGPVYAFDSRHLLPSLSAALHGRPPETAQYQSPVLHDLVRKGNYDIIQIEETLLAPYAESIPRGAATKTVLTFHNIHFQQTRRIAALESSVFRRAMRRANAAWMRQYEPRIARKFDRVITVTADDRALLAPMAPGVPIEVLPNGVDTQELTPLPEPSGPPAIVFAGTMNYRPCIDGAQWLVREILPLLRAKIPDLAVWIVGRSPAPEVAALAGNGVHVTGTVPETTPYYARSTVAVVPLRAGGGSRLKILEAMAFGRPVVSTKIGAEGLDASDGADLLLADAPVTFSDAIVRLLEDAPLRQSLIARARDYVERVHDWSLIADRQLEIYRELVPNG